MIINKDFYICNKCNKGYSFDTSNEYSKLCPICNTEMEFFYNGDCDTELAEKVKNQKPIVPSTKPTIKCPTCGSTQVKRISTTAKVVGATMFGLFSKTAQSQFECLDCKYKW